MAARHCQPDARAVGHSLPVSAAAAASLPLLLPVCGATNGPAWHCFVGLAELEQEGQEGEDHDVTRLMLQQQV